MPYATLQDVLDQAPKIQLGPTSKPSAADAQKLVDRVNAHVDSVLRGLGYTVPIDSTVSPQSFAILKDIVVAGSTAKILKAMYYGIKDPEEVGANDAWKEFSGKLKDLANPEHPLGLPDAAPHIWAQKVITEVGSNVLEAAYLAGDADVDGYSETTGRLTRNQVF